METAAGKPVQPASASGVLPAGGHVRQLLNLAHALAGHGATASSKDGTATGATVPGNAAGVGSVVMDVASLTDAQCLGWAQDVEAALRMGQALAVQIAGELGRRVAAGRFAQTGSRGPVGLLVDALQLSAAEASRRLKLASVVLPVVDGISGAVAPVAHPVLGEAFFSGAVSQERASMVTRYLADADRLAAEGRISAETRELVEESLVGTARVQGPDFVRTVGNQIMGHIDPDGHKPSHAELLAKQGLFFHRPRNGLISFHGAVTLLQHEELMAALDGFTNANKHKNIDTINTTPSTDTDTTDGGGAGSEVDGCAGQSSLLDGFAGLGGVAGLFPSTATPTPTAQPGPGDDPQPPDDPDMPDPRLTGVQAEPPDHLQGAEPPGPGVADGGTAASFGVNGGVGWWGRRLESWEIPARPPEAPEYATPPVYEGQDWFWLPTEPATHGWTTPTTNANSSGSDGGSFNIFEDAPTRWPVTRWDETFNFWQEHTAANALAATGNTGDTDGTMDATDVGDACEARVEQVLAGLDSIDPSSTDPAVKDTRTRGQRLLDGLISCVKLA